MKRTHSRRLDLSTTTIRRLEATLKTVDGGMVPTSTIWQKSEIQVGGG